MPLYLVRHGRAAAGVSALDPGLDPIGVQQAERAAEALRTSGARRLVVSPLRRTVETAARIATALGLTPEVRAEVTEVFDPTQSPESRAGMLGPLLAGCWSEQDPSLRAFRARVLSALVDLGDDSVIVVSHFVAICAAIGEATGDDRVACHPVANASITTLDVLSGRLVLRRANDTSHLTPELLTVSAALPGAPRSSSTG